MAAASIVKEKDHNENQEEESKDASSNKPPVHTLGSDYSTRVLDDLERREMRSMARDFSSIYCGSYTSGFKLLSCLVPISTEHWIFGLSCFKSIFYKNWSAQILNFLNLS